MEIQTSTTEYRSDGERVQAFLARPVGLGPYPAVIAIHEIWGLVDHIRDVASRLAREGFVGCAVDLFGGRTFADIREGQQYAARLLDSTVTRILGHAQAYLQSQSYVKRDAIAVIGFCMGSRYALLMACHNPDLAASVVFYGRPVNRELTERTPQHPIDLVSRMTCPLLGIFGEADDSIPLELVNRLRAELQKHGKTYEIYTYPNAPHAFFNDTRPERFRPEAARDAWQKTLAFLRKHLTLT